MWAPRVVSSTSSSVRYQIFEENGDVLLTCQRFTTLLQESEAFGEFFNELLATGNAFPGFFWETKPMRHGYMTEVLEFTVSRAPALERIEADPQTFEKLQEGKENGAVSFLNLGKDAVLVSPFPNAQQDLQSYAHLANFVRQEIGRASCRERV